MTKCLAFLYAVQYIQAMLFPLSSHCCPLLVNVTPSTFSKKNTINCFTDAYCMCSLKITDNHFLY